MYHEVKTAEAIRYITAKPTMIITTLHESGVVNAGVFGAYTNLSPQHIGAAIAKSSHTYANILRSGEFVINIPGADLVKAIAVLADDIPPERSEVAEAGLTTKDGITISTPSIAECAAAVELKLDREVPITSHSFLIGQVTGGWIRQEFLGDDGRIDVFKARAFKDFKYPKPLYFLPGEVIEG
ncbi:MAG TPA: flavin reductase family protein [Phycisphaerae bacterium]|nr:flavin reductase family protein [Phycisphaerae bacterium]